MDPSLYIQSIGIHNFETEEKLGTGSSSVVYLVKSPEKKRLVLKISKKHKWNNSLKKEIYILKYLTKINCPFTPKFYDQISVGNLRSLVVEHTESSYTLSEARDFLVNRIKILNKLIVNLLRAIYFLHSHGIYHCDIKPDNILYIKENSQVLLIDFDASKINNEEIKYNLDDNSRGTYAYMSPEFFSTVTHPELLPGCDIWSLGATLFKLITGDVFFKLNEGQRCHYGTFIHFYNNPRGGYQLFAKEKISNFLHRNKYVESLVKSCLTFNIQLRPTIYELVDNIPEA